MTETTQIPPDKLRAFFNTSDCLDNTESASVWVSADAVPQLI